MPGDIAYNKMRAWQGAMGYRSIEELLAQRTLLSARDASTNQGISLPVPDTCVRQEANDGHMVLPRINGACEPEHFKRIYTCVPPPDEQAAIVRYLDYVDRRIRRYIRAKQKLIELLESRSRPSSTAPSPAASTPMCPSRPPASSGWGMCPRIGSVATQDRIRWLDHSRLSDRSVPNGKYRCLGQYDDHRCVGDDY